MPQLHKELLKRLTYIRYQERYIANRKIAFLKELVIFQCQVDTFREDIIHLNPAILVDIQYRREYSLGFSPKNFGTPNAEYKKTIEAYSDRTLSYQSDILNAFAGISRHLGNSLGAKQLLFGMPMYEKDIIPARYLGWKHRASQSRPWARFQGRRVGFPSWSWCGWIGPVDMVSNFDERMISEYETKLRVMYLRYSESLFVGAIWNGRPSDKSDAFTIGLELKTLAAQFSLGTPSEVSRIMLSRIFYIDALLTVQLCPNYFFFSLRLFPSWSTRLLKILLCQPLYFLQSRLPCSFSQLFSSA